MKVVLDANVVIAAFAARGLCADIFEHCLYEQSVVLSNSLLTEIHHNLYKKIKVPKSKADKIRKFLSGVAEIVRPTKLPKNVCRDPKDAKVVGTAVAAKAEVIVTGDKDLLALKKFRSIQILTPRDFWKYVQQAA